MEDKVDMVTRPAADPSEFMGGKKRLLNLVQSNGPKKTREEPNHSGEG